MKSENAGGLQEIDEYTDMIYSLVRHTPKRLVCLYKDLPCIVFMNDISCYIQFNDMGDRLVLVFSSNFDRVWKKNPFIFTMHVSK